MKICLKFSQSACFNSKTSVLILIKYGANCLRWQAKWVLVHITDTHCVQNVMQPIYSLKASTEPFQEIRWKNIHRITPTIPAQYPQGHVIL